MCVTLGYFSGAQHALLDQHAAQIVCLRFQLSTSIGIFGVTSGVLITRKRLFLEIGSQVGVRQMFQDR